MQHFTIGNQSLHNEEVNNREAIKSTSLAADLELFRRELSGKWSDMSEHTMTHWFTDTVHHITVRS